MIDPSLETDAYLGLAEAQGWRVSSVFETHLHADHLSRARSVGTGERSGPLSSCARARIVHLPAGPRGHTHRYMVSNDAASPPHAWPYA